MKKCFKDTRCQLSRKCSGESGLFLKMYLTFVNSALLVLVIILLMYILHSREVREFGDEENKMLDLLKIINNILSSNLNEFPASWVQYLAVVTTCTAGVLSFLGCCGACTESICFIGFHGILSLMFLFFEVVISIVFITYQNEIWASTSSALQYSIRHVYNSSSNSYNVSHPSVVAVTRTWDALQIKYNCCAVFGPEDYKYSLWYNSTNDSEAYFVPISCCITSDLGHREGQLKNLRSTLSSGFHPSAEQDNMCQIDAILYPRFKSHRRSYLRRRGCREIFEEIFLNCQPLIVMTASVLLVIHVVNSIVSFRLIHWLRQRFADVSSYCNEDSNEDT